MANRGAALHMTRSHHGGEPAGEVEEARVANARSRGVLAGEDGARVDGLALGVDEGKPLVEGLLRGEPLECGRGGRCGVKDKEGGVVREGEVNVAALDCIRRGERKRDGCTGMGIEDSVDGERAGVERERTGVGGGESEKSRAMDGGGGEVKVEGEGEVGGERVGGVREGVRVNGCHFGSCVKEGGWLFA